MGYRFQLVNGTFPTQVTRGSAYQAQVAISNTGVAPLYNERPVQVLIHSTFRSNQILRFYFYAGRSKE